MQARRSPSPQRRAGSPERRERLRRDRELFARYHDPSSPVDREMVVGRFLPLARQLAAGYAHTNQSFDDLFQVACVGLVNAIDRFDSTRDIAFSSYAVPTILGELKRYFRDKTWSVRVPRDLQELGLGIERESERLTARLGRPPTIDEVADAVGASRGAVLEARGALGAYHAGSLEDSHSGRDDDDPLLSVLGCDDAGYDGVEQRVLLDSMLGCLTRRERDVVRLRFEDDLTQMKIADEIGISQMQVSRILRRSLERLREVLTDDAAPPDEIPRAA